MPRDYDPRQVVRMLWCLTCRICTVTVWNADQVCAKCGKPVHEEPKPWQNPTTHEPRTVPADASREGYSLGTLDVE